MSEPYIYRLDGCAPTPLASYLKALGVLRLLATAVNNAKGEAADAAARGWWAGEHFYLKSRLDHDALLRFFLDDYAPSPIIAPWNGRAGFLEGDAGAESGRTGAQLMKAIEASRSDRFGNMRSVIMAFRRDPMLVQYDKLRADTKAQANREKRALKLAARAAQKKKSSLADRLLEVSKRAQEHKKEFARLAENTKSELLPSLRSNADSRHLRFIDACFVLAEDERAAPLLGSGGNDGSRDFGVNFAESLDALFDLDTGLPKSSARGEFEASIFGAARRLDVKGSIGQFDPGQGGVNASTRYEGWNALNRWNILLALEGTLLFAGALTRHWGTAGSTRAAFPYTFEPSGAGAGALSSQDPNAPRGELWTPLWAKPSSLIEIGALLAEGRLTLGRLTARTGLDAARAIARLGTSRGITAFERYSLIQPDAKMPYQATPLGRFTTPERPRTDPIVDLDAGGWLWRVHRFSREKNAPARAKIAVRRLDDALFDIAREGCDHSDLQGALMALGSVVSWLATSREGREEISPPPLLGGQWMYDANDNSPEFRIAAALASIGWPPKTPHNAEEQKREGATADTSDSAKDEGAIPEEMPDGVANPSDSEQAPDIGHKSTPPMAAHFVPVEERTIARRFRRWAENDPPGVVWGAGSLVQNMIAVLERRLIEKAIRGMDDKPLGGASPARLADVAAFLEGASAFDDARCAALLAGLVWVRLSPLERRGGDAPVSFAYAVLKLLFTPDNDLRLRPGLNADARQFLSPSGTLPVPPGLVGRLRRGDHDALESAVRIALSRARASGISSPFSSRITASTRLGAGVDPVRLAAALLIPIDERSLTTLMKRAYPKLMKRAYPKDSREEDTDNAA